MSARTGSSGEAGFSIFAFLAIAAVASVLVLSLLGRMQVLARDRVRSAAADAAFWAAQGGLEKARAALAADPGWTGGAAMVGVGRAEVSVETVEGEPSLRRVRSLGTDPGLGTEATAARRTLVAILRLGPADPRTVEWREEP